jgi:hypothetical protein
MANCLLLLYLTLSISFALYVQYRTHRNLGINMYHILFSFVELSICRNSILDLPSFLHTKYISYLEAFFQTVFSSPSPSSTSASSIRSSIFFKYVGSLALVYWCYLLGFFDSYFILHQLSCFLETEIAKSKCEWNNKKRKQKRALRLNGIITETCIVSLA